MSSLCWWRYLSSREMFLRLKFSKNNSNLSLHWMTSTSRSWTLFFNIPSWLNYHFLMRLSSRFKAMNRSADDAMGKLIVTLQNNLRAELQFPQTRSFRHNIDEVLLTLHTFSKILQNVPVVQFILPRRRWKHQAANQYPENLSLASSDVSHRRTFHGPIRNPMPHQHTSSSAISSTVAKQEEKAFQSRL